MKISNCGLMFLLLLAVGLSGCSRDLNRGEVCALGSKFVVMENVDKDDNHAYFWLSPVVNKEHKPTPCPEQKP